MKKIVLLLLILSFPSFAQVKVTGKSTSYYSITNDPDTVTIYTNGSGKLAVKPSSLDTSKFTSAVNARLLTTAQKNELQTIAAQHFVDLHSSFSAAIDSGKVTTISPEDTVTVADSTQGLISNSILLGSGESSVITTSKSTTASLAAITIDSDSNIIISNIHFKPQNNGSYNTEFDHAITITDSAKNILITNCIFDCVGDGVYIGGSTAQPENIVITNCTFRGDSLTAYNPPCSRNGISIVNGKNIRITNNYFKGFHDPGCIDLEPNPNEHVEGVVISGNTFIPQGHGVSLAGGSSSTSTINDVIISDNHFDLSQYLTARTAVHAATNAYEGSLTNVTIDGNTIQGGGDGVYGALHIAGQASEVRVTNNIIYDHTLHGIQVSPGVKNISVSNNTCYDNYQDGIYFYGTVDDRTSDLGNVNFELDDTQWSDYGTPTTSSRSSSEIFQGNYSWKIVTDAADEGITQIINISSADTFSIFDIKAYVYLANDGTHGTVSMSVGGDRYELSGRDARESHYNQEWEPIRTFFKPSANDTLYISGSKSGMTFYVDSLTITKRNGAINAEVTNNRCYGNNTYGGAYNGIRLGQFINGIVSGNNVSNLPKIPGVSTTQYRGLYLGGVFFTDINNNIGNLNTNVDLYADNVEYCKLSTIGFDNVYSDRTKDYKENTIKDAKVLTFREDSLSSGISTRLLQFLGHTMQVQMPTSGRIVGLSAFLTSPMTAGTMKIYPQIGSSVSSDISGRSYLYLTMTGNASTDVYSGTLPFVLVQDYLDFQEGDIVSVAIYTDGSFATSATSYLTVQLLYE